MITFSYKGRDATGTSVGSTIEARSKDDAMRALQQQGVIVTELRVGTPEVDVDAVMMRRAARNVPRDAVIAFASQMSVMIEAGVPLAEALRAFVDQCREPSMKRVVGVVTSRVTSGVPISDAMAEFPKVFPVTMLSLMRASEASGTMGPMLQRIAEYLERERRTRRQIAGALTYPAVMVALAVAVTGFLVAYVLPRFASIYASREATLPTPTRIILGLSEAVQAHWPTIIAGVIAAAFAGLAAASTKSGRRFIDSLKINAPVLGPMFRQFYLTRAMRTLGTLLGSGVQVLDAVSIVRGVTGNSYWDDLWDELAEAMTAGRPMAGVVLESALIPPSVGQMIVAGERGGRLAEVLERVGASTETDLDEAVTNATQLIEPAMILFMGATIGGIAIALLLPIFSVAQTVSQ